MGVVDSRERRDGSQRPRRFPLGQVMVVLAMLVLVVLLALVLVCNAEALEG